LCVNTKLLPIFRKTYSLSLALGLCCAFLSWSSAQAQTASCAAPGKDGPNFSAPTYYPGNATASAGNTSISLGATRTVAIPNDSIASTSGAPGTTALSPGDLVLIIQMQDASYNNNNGVAFGDGTNGRGWTNLNNSGGYEFRRVVSYNGATVNIDAPLSFTYTRSTPSAGTSTAANGNRRFQVIRVPQFSNVALPGGTISPPGWDGETGGVWVIDVANNLNMAGTTINATALGFRGGGSWPNGNVPGSTSYVQTFAFNTAIVCADTGGSNVGSAKGEGIAGTPRLVRRQSGGSNTAAAGYSLTFGYVDLLTSGYAGADTAAGFLARGAAGNAGGGGTQHNAGGGGGSNVGQGGRGGNTFAFYSATNTGGCVTLTLSFFGCGGDGARTMGGLGGGSLPASINNIIMGGGGGAGDNNNACDAVNVPQGSGGNGGGIIFIRAGTISGNGNLFANGQNGLPAGRDAAGGGGAGGSVVVLTSTNNPALTIQANAGQGGNTGFTGTGGVAGTFLRAGETQGPAGGGGGGAVVRSNNIPAGGFTSVAFNGGAAGANFPVQANTGINNNYGAGSGGGAAASAPFVPSSNAIDANCVPNVSVSKRTTTPLVNYPTNNTAQYVITLSNAGPGGAVGTTLRDTLQAPFEYNPSTAPLNQIGLAYTGGAAGPASPTTGAGTRTFTVGTAGSNSTADSFYLAPNSTVSFTVTVQINGSGVTPTFGTVYQNTVTLSFLDPRRTAATTTVSPGSPYAGTTTTALGSNYNATSSTQEDVTVVGVTNVTISKSNGITSPSSLVAGQTFNYTITVANSSGTASIDLVNGVLRDPAAPGLQCTNVSCVVPAGSTSVCPAVGVTTMANLQGAGLTIPLLRSGTVGPPASQRLEFIVTCGVTANGQ
jgi:hypothetical protein